MEQMKEGWLLRVYAAKPQDVAKRVERAANMAVAIKGVSNSPIMVMVPSDKDCGQTAELLRKKNLHMIVIEQSGSQNTEVLNRGVGGTQ